MLELKVEWLDAPGVKSKALAETWGQLTITATDLDGQRLLLSRLISAAAKSERTTIYGSVFPLAEWVVENWWFLLNEPSRIPEISSGRKLAALPTLRSWAQRHNLLTARHGGALPDVSLYRDHEHVVAKAFPDPDSERDDRPVRFMAQGEIRLSPHDVEQGLDAFVQQVLARLDAVHEVEVDRLRAEWTALCGSRRNEADLCTWSASMGLDPYDPGALTDELVELLETRLPGLSSELRTDFVEATSATTIGPELDWIGKARDEIGIAEALDPSFDWANGAAQERPKTPYDWGYRWARRFRERFQLQAGPIDDLPKVLHSRCHWPWNTGGDLLDGSPELRLNGLVASSRDGVPRVFYLPRNPEAMRFVLARSLFFVPLLRHAAGPRLVTKAYTWQQAASRAFAAELLAPAEALWSELSGGVGQERLEAVASQFRVSTKVIEHQVRNHDIGWIEES